MIIIGSAAHFVVCTCGGHGRLVTAAGEESVELCSKEKARLALGDGVKKGKISENVELHAKLRRKLSIVIIIDSARNQLEK